MTLRPASYQLVALTKLLLPYGGRLLITDGVGVGKTISAGYCVTWTLRAERQNVLVVCPVSLVDKWLLELREKFGLEAHPIRSEEELATANIESERANRPRAYVLPASRIGFQVKFPVGLIVVDEIHNYRNPRTASWRNIRKLALGAKWRVGLSATPINNKPEDLFAIYSILYAEYHPLAVESALRSFWEGRRHKILNQVMTRFEKDKLGIHFARREIHHVLTEYPEVYVNHVNKTVHDLTGKASREGGYPLETITYFRAGASAPPTFAKTTHSTIPKAPDPKAAQLVDLVLSKNRQAIIFCQFKETVNYLAIRLAEANVNTYSLTGDVPPSDRHGILRQFQRDSKSVILLTAVGSEGLDMQFCDVVINYDLHWNPMVIEQRIGRIDRVGQKKNEIEVYNFHVLGSIDERVMTVMATKLDAIKGTPFEPAPISSTGPRMYNDLAAKFEEKDAGALAASIQALKQLDSADLAVLPSIDPIYCSPDKLATSTPLAWLDPSSKTAATWREAVTESYRLVSGQLEESAKLV